MSSSVDTSRSSDGNGDEVVQNAGPVGGRSKNDLKWEEMFDGLKKFHAAKGHFRVPRDFTHAGKSLPVWIMYQRKSYRDRKSKSGTPLSDERLRKLQEIGFPLVVSPGGKNPTKDQPSWEDMFNALLQFREEHGHFNPPLEVKHGGKSLAGWANAQRRHYQNRTKERGTQLSTEQVRRLQAAGFDLNATGRRNRRPWEELFDALKEFGKKNGHFTVPYDYLYKGQKLFNWLKYQRKLFRKKALSHARAQKLQEIGAITAQESTLSSSSAADDTETESDSADSDDETVYTLYSTPEEDEPMASSVGKTGSGSKSSGSEGAFDSDPTETDVSDKEDGGVSDVDEAAMDYPLAIDEKSWGPVRDSIPRLDDEILEAEKKDFLERMFVECDESEVAETREAELESPILYVAGPALGSEFSSGPDSWPTVSRDCVIIPGSLKPGVQPESVEDRRVVRAKKLLPKCIGKTTRRLLTSEELNTIVSELSTLNSSSFSYKHPTLVDSATDVNSVILQVEGSRDEVNLLGRRVRKLIRQKVKRFNKRIESAKVPRKPSLSSKPDTNISAKGTTKSGETKSSDKKEPSIPRKRSLSSDAGPGISTGGDTIPRIAKKKRSSSSKDHLSDSGHQKEYSYTFKSSDPLGFFCVTDISGKATVCRISSIQPDGQASKDCRIQAGTIIVGMVVDKKRKSLQGHEDLKAAYDHAVEKKEDLVLHFINRDVRSGSTANDGRREWASGRWKGKGRAGWAGGAPTYHFAPPVQQKAPGTAQTIDPDTQNNSGEVRENKAEEADEEWVVRVSTKNTHCTYKAPLKSIMRSVEGGRHSSGNRLRRALKWATTVEERRYYKPDIDFEGSRSTEFLVRPTDQSASTLSDAVETEEDPLNDSILYGSFEDVLKLFENGAVSSLSSTDKSIKPLIESHQLLKAKRSSPRSANDAAMKEMLEQKDTLLKIYRTSEHAIQQSRALKHWVKLEVLVSRIEIRTSDIPPGAVLRVVPESEIDGKREPLRELDKMPIDRCVTYEGQKSFHLRFNAKVAANRAFHLILRAESPSRPPSDLGCASFKLSDLYTKCSRDGEWRDVELLAETKSGGEANTVVIRCRRYQDEKMLKDKHDALKKELGKVIDWIIRFNEDLRASPSSQKTVSANIRIGNMSLLHAAIYAEDYEMVRNLIRLGADPTSKSKSGGSALSLAINMADGFIGHTYDEGSQVQHVPNSQEQSRQRRSEERQAHIRAIVEFIRESLRLRNELQGDENAVASREPDRLDQEEECKNNGTDKTIERKIPGQKRNNHVEEQTHLSASNAATTVQQPSMNPGENMSLPTDLDSLWLVPKDRICVYFNSRTGCRRGHSCRWWHILRPTESFIRAYSGPPSRSTHIKTLLTIKEGKDAAGREWFTSGFKDAQTREAIYAVGGPGHMSKEGVWWYESRDAAETALRTVFAAVHDQAPR